MMLKSYIAALVMTLSCGGTEGSIDGAGNEAADSCDKSEITEPTTEAGQLVFTLDASIDPCQVTGFVVGESESQLKYRGDNQYFFDEVPPGDQDIIIVSKLAVGAELYINTGTPRARRIKVPKISPKFQRNLNQIDLPFAGAINGVVKLQDREDHSGIHVYIPGTSYQARTDSDGNYRIAPFVPVGTNNLYFEHDGYHRGQIEEIEVETDVSTIVPGITLYLSTGASGFVLIDAGNRFSTSGNVALSIGATEDAALMKISSLSSFAGAEWRPVITTTTHSFTGEGDKTIYIKFADTNGLESSPFSDSIIIDTSAPALELTFDYSGRGNIVFSAVESNIVLPIKEITYSTEPKFIDSHTLNFTSKFELPYASHYYFKFGDEALRKTEMNLSIVYAPKLSYDRWWLKAVSTTNRVVFAGGTKGTFGSEVRVNVIDVYNPETNLWYTNKMSDSRDQFSVNLWNGKIIFSGGVVQSAYNDNTYYSAKIDIYDPVQNTMKSTSLSERRGHLGTIIHNNLAYFAGGYEFDFNTGSKYSNLIQRYNLATDTWLSDLILSNSRREVAVAEHEDKIYFAGGRDSSAYIDTLDIYDTINNSMVTTTITGFTAGFSRVDTATVFEGKIYFTGFSTDILIYDPTQNSWSKHTLSSGQNVFKTRALGNKLIVQGARFFAQLEAGSWTVVETPNGHSTPDDLFIGADSIVFAGGFMNGIASSLVSIYHLSDQSWTILDRELDIWGMGIAELDGKILFAGGVDNLTTYDSVEIFDLQSRSWAEGL